jgi:hypothetical protein
MSAAVLDINVEQNSDFLAVVSVTDGANPPAAVNLTGKSIYGQIRESRSSEILQNFTVFITNATGGVFQFSLTASQTKTLRVTSPLYPLRYDLLMIGNDGSHRRLFMGNVNVTEAITFV